VGVQSSILFTSRLVKPKSYEEEQYARCPAVYQELVPGRRHMRLICFGEQALAAMIETDDLDWRANLHVPITPCPVPKEIQEKAVILRGEFGLEMGVFDLKERSDGEWNWLEVNPQGRFLFLQPLTGLSLAERFFDFFLGTAM
jgi:glutathione synthase/RimK-type ligase-like ATP-grasp enzyme